MIEITRSDKAIISPEFLSIADLADPVAKSDPIMIVLYYEYVGLTWPVSINL